MSDEVKETTLGNVYVPEHQKDWIDEQPGTLKENVQEAISLLMLVEGDPDPETLERELSRVQERKAEAEERARRHLDEADELEQKADRIEARIEEARKAAVSYDEALDTILNRADETGMYVFADNPKVCELAERYDRRRDEIVEDLQERAEDLPAEKFNDPREMRGEADD